MLAALIVDGIASTRKNLIPTEYSVGDPVWALYGDGVDATAAEGQ